MQTTGASLLAVSWCIPPHVRTPVQDSLSAHGLLYLAAVREDLQSRNAVNAELTSGCAPSKPARPVTCLRPTAGSQVNCQVKVYGPWTI
jgi:hypothetical protein